ncbi:MAG: DNA-binding protein [Nitrosopumilus sp.]
MLMEEIPKQDGQGQTKKLDDSIIVIGNDPVMQSAVSVLSILGNKRQILLRAKGNAIPNAVAVANIITEKMLNGNSKIGKITLDTESAAGIGRMTSTIEIILNKI